MDFEEKKKRQLIRVVIAEVGMVLSVIAIVIVSTLAAMGFIITDSGEIEQSGLIQLHSLPTGANVKIDGNTIFSRTNLSRTLSAGEHDLELSRDGYDTWQNKIKVHSGVLLRVYYPRLFLQNRTSEQVMSLATNDNLEFYAPSTKRNYILYAEKGSSDWQLLDLRGDEIKQTILDLSAILPGMVEEKTSAVKTNSAIEKYQYKFQGVIDEIVWSDNEDRALVKVTYDSKTEWVLLYLRDLARSLNLTRTFGLGETALAMIDGSAEQLYMLEKRQLRRINTNDGVMSKVLLDNVVDFANYGTNVVYVTENSTTKERAIGVYRYGEKDGTIIKEVPKDVKLQVALSRYYDEDYVAYMLDSNLYVLRGKIPSYNENGTDLSDLTYLSDDANYSVIPDKLTVSPGGEYLLAYKDSKIMVMDLDMGDTYEYDVVNKNFAWLDASMLYTIKDQQILVWDFDGANLRNLSESAKTDQQTAVKVLDKSPVTITANNRWMYYLTKGDKFTYLARERIRD